MRPVSGVKIMQYGCIRKPLFRHCQRLRSDEVSYSFDDEGKDSFLDGAPAEWMLANIEFNHETSHLLFFPTTALLSYLHVADSESF